jgi:hypothetical protein
VLVVVALTPGACRPQTTCQHQSPVPTSATLAALQARAWLTPAAAC